MISIQKHPAFTTGVVLAKQENFAGSLEKFKDLLALQPRCILDILISLYRQLALEEHNLALRTLIAELCILGKLYANALEEVEALFELSPAYPPLYSLVGKLYKKKQGHPILKQILETAFQQGISDSTILDLLPGLYLEEKNIQKSILIFEKLVEERTESLHYAKTLVGLYEEAGQFEQAMKLYENLVEKSPTCVNEAVEFSEKLIRYSPNSFFLRKVGIKLNMKACNPMQAIAHMHFLLSEDPAYSEEAIQTYKHILDLYPDTPDVLIELAQVLIQVERYSEAVTCLRHVFENEAYPCDTILVHLDLILSKYPQQAMALQLLMETTYKLGRYIETLGYIDILIGLDIEDPFIVPILSTLISKVPSLNEQARHYLQRYYFSQKQYALCLEEGKQLSTQNPASLILSATALEKTGALFEGILLLREHLPRHPFDKPLHQALQTLVSTEAQLMNTGQGFLKEGQLEIASQHFQKVSQDSPEFMAAQLWLNRCFVEMGRLDLAIQQLLPQLDHLPPQNEEAHYARYLVGVQLIQAGQVVEGLTHLERILQYNIQFPFVQTILSQYQKESVYDFRGKVLSACFDQPGGHCRLITVRNREGGKYTGAQTISFAQSHNNQGVDYALKGHFKSAKEAFQVALELDSLTATYCNLAMVSMSVGEFDQAAVFLDQAEKQHDKLDVIFLNRALLALNQQDFSSALTHCKSARALNPDNPFIKLTLGDCYFQKNQLKEAFSYWDQAAKTGLVYPYIQRRIEYSVPQLSTFEQQLFLTVPLSLLV